jgi:hypothetical protein
MTISNDMSGICQSAINLAARDAKHAGLVRDPKRALLVFGD